MDFAEYFYNNLLHLPYLEFHEIAMIIKGYEDADLVPLDPSLQKFTKRKFLFLNKKTVGFHAMKPTKLKKDKELYLLKTIFFPPIGDSPFRYQKKEDHLIDVFLESYKKGKQFHYRIKRVPQQTTGIAREYLEVNDLWFVEPQLFFAIYLISGGTLPKCIQKGYGIDQTECMIEKLTPKNIAIDAVSAVLQHEENPKTYENMVNHPLMTKIGPDSGSSINNRIHKRVKEICNGDLNKKIEFPYIWGESGKVCFEKLFWVLKSLTLAINYYPQKHTSSLPVEEKIRRIQNHSVVRSLLEKMEGNTRKLAKIVIQLISGSDQSLRYIDSRVNFLNTSFQKIKFR